MVLKGKCHKKSTAKVTCILFKKCRYPKKIKIHGDFPLKNVFSPNLYMYVNYINLQHSRITINFYWELMRRLPEKFVEDTGKVFWKLFVKNIPKMWEIPETFAEDT